MRLLSLQKTKLDYFLQKIKLKKMKDFQRELNKGLSNIKILIVSKNT
jgi:hypothetical protein